MRRGMIHWKGMSDPTIEVGSNGRDCMVARLEFDLSVDGGPRQPLHAFIKQPVGGTSADPLEVTRPVGLRGPFNQDFFAQAAEHYYRQMFRAEPGSRVSIHGAGMLQIRMVGDQPIDLPEDDAKTW